MNMIEIFSYKKEVKFFFPSNILNFFILDLNTPEYKCILNRYCNFN